MTELSGPCPGWLKIKRVCGCEQLIPVPCRDPLCIPCQKLIAYHVRERWSPVVEGMRSPKLITLTIRGGQHLADRVKVLSTSFDRLLDIRLGLRNWPKFRELAREFLALHLVENEPSQAVRDSRLEALGRSQDRLGRDIRAWYRTNGRWPRLRDLIGPGFSTLEVTYSQDHGWHPHRHLVTDSSFIPWALLVVLWREASQGEGQIVDIRAIKREDRGAMREAVKYVTKPWEIPSDKADELRQVLFGRKRVWPLGGARPVCHEAKCPGCGEPTSRCHALDVGFADTVWSNGRDRAMIRLRSSGEVLAIQRVGGRWQSLLLIPMRFACHSALVRDGPGP